MSNLRNKIILGFIIFFIGASINIFVKRMISTNPSSPSVEEIMAQQASKIKSECPIKIDDLTSLMDINFEPDKKRLIYLFKYNIDEKLLMTKEELDFLKEFFSASLCKTFITQLPPAYNAQIVCVNKDNKEIMDIFLDEEICKKYEKLGPPPEELKEFFDTPQTRLENR